MTVGMNMRTVGMKRAETPLRFASSVGRRVTAPDSFIRFGEINPVPALDAAEQQAVHDVGEDYKSFLKISVCGPLTAKEILDRAKAEGFKPLPQTGRAKPGGKYYVANGLESVALVVTGKRDPRETGFNIVGAHIDSPQLELKPDPEFIERGMMKLKTKVRGGMIMESWKDKPLGIAGRVFEPVLDGDGRPKLDPVTLRPQLNEKFIRIDSPAVVIPRVPIHFDRTVNDGVKVEPENDLAVLAGNFVKHAEANGEENTDFTPQVRAAFAQNGINLDTIAGAELYLFPAIPPTDALYDTPGGSAIIGQGHDDRAMSYTAMAGLFDAAKAATESEKTSIAFFFNNEETGSLNRGGATSNFPLNVAGQVLRAQNGRKGESVLDRETAFKNSVIYSADVAHSWEPGQKKYHDAQNAVQMGYGPAIKADSNGRYATTAEGIALSDAIAARAGVPLQTYSTNQDIPCGTTIGPMIASGTNALTVDIGIPILGMHSALEVADKRDVYYTRKLFASFFKNE